MDETTTLACLAALAQPSRLNAFRLLVARGTDGIAAGDVARLLGVPQNTMSAHLSTLTACGLVQATRQSRSIIYRADLARLQSVVLFLLKDCCGGRPEICAPLLDALSPCCPASPISEATRCD